MTGDVLKGIGIFVFVFLIEAVVAAFIISIFWKLSLQVRLDIYLSFFDWVGLILGFKLIRFNSLHFIPFNALPQNKQEDEVH